MGSIRNTIITETYFEEACNVPVSLINTDTVGGKVTYHRVAKDLLQRELAKLCNLDRATIIRLENNQVQPSLYILKTIALVLEIDVALLLDDYFKFLLEYDTTIKCLRKDLKLTQLQLGAILKVHRKTICRWENRSIKPTRDNYNRLVSKLNLNKEETHKK
ncbi:MAG: helix-turn-helix transcriptional regulator [Cellulosilyticaceae bacterium]